MDWPQRLGHFELGDKVNLGSVILPRRKDRTT